MAPATSSSRGKGGAVCTDRQATLPDGSVTGYAYDADGLLASIETTLPSGVLSRTYGRNENGQVTSENAERFSYDDLGRLSAWFDASADATTTYSYDAAFNLTSVTRDGTPLRSFTYDDGNRITTSGFTYDGRGNLTCDGARIYAFDAANRLTSVIDAETSATVATYAYDAFNRRVRASEGATTTVFHYAGTSGNVIAETDGAGSTIATYAYGAGGRLHSMTRGGATYYYHLNARGDVVALSDADGEVVNEYRYDPWGNVLAAIETVANPYRYAGYRLDKPSGLYYCWNRHYAPVLGRFLQRDLIPGQLTRPASMNPYAYCEGDPVNGVDPMGLMIVRSTADRITLGVTGAVEMSVGECLRVWAGVRIAEGLAVIGGTEGAAALPGAGLIVAGGLVWLLASPVSADGRSRLEFAASGSLNCEQDSPLEAFGKTAAEGDWAAAGGAYAKTLNPLSGVGGLALDVIVSVLGDPMEAH